MKLNTLMVYFFGRQFPLSPLSLFVPPKGYRLTRASRTGEAIGATHPIPIQIFLEKVTDSI
jgi:hypothetical protein